MSRAERKEVTKSEKKEKRKQRARNKEFAIVTYLFVILFLALMGFIIYFQLTSSEEFAQSPYNQREKTLAQRITRGSILDRNAEVLAETVVVNGEESRYYPQGDLFAHVVGYSAKGKTGIESAKSKAMLTSNEFILQKIENEFKGQKDHGDHILTTLDIELQRSVYDALGSSKGAVMVMNPQTGEILAMVSKPCFDPNTIVEDWEQLNENEDGVLLNRVTQGQYAPGSTFKLVTALSYMREHKNFEDYEYECNGEIEGGVNTIHCFGGTSHGTLNLRDSLAYSCNTSFSNIGNSLDVSDFRETAKDLLFNSKLPCDLSSKKSTFELGDDAVVAEKMMTAIGQGETQVSPYHLALITSAIANHGMLMRPHLVKSIVNYESTIVSEVEPEEYQRLMSKEEAATLMDYMSSVTDYGTAKTFNGSPYSVAGKTGTAEYSSDKEKDHSWFVGIYGLEKPELVVSIVIEASDGTSKAVNVAKEIFDNYYN